MYSGYGKEGRERVSRTRTELYINRYYSYMYIDHSPVRPFWPKLRSRLRNILALFFNKVKLFHGPFFMYFVW